MALLSTIRDLRRRKGRERRGLTLAEGVRLVEEALDVAVPLRGAAHSPALEGTPRGAELKRRLEHRGVPLECVTDAELVELADTEHPQGIVAVVAPRVWTLAEIPVVRDAVVLLLDGVQDPGNVGAVARTALALGAAGLITLPGTADLWNPKALRGSMGALFRLPAVHADPEAVLTWIREAGLQLWTTGAMGTPIGQARPAGPLAIALGNEGAGVTPAIAAAAAVAVTVPLRRGVESLNVAVAAGILLYEVTRDR